MSDIERAIGRLEGKVDAIEETVKRIELHFSNCPHRQDIEDLKKFKWSFTFIPVIITSVVTAVITRHFK